MYDNFYRILDDYIIRESMCGVEEDTGVKGKAAVDSCDGVKRSCCIYNNKKRKIILFVEANKENKEIEIYLKGKLPEYMLPGEYVQMDNLPLNR